MATNDFLEFCHTDTGTNLLTQVEYAADADRTSGNKPGVASSKLNNKALRQANFITSQLAQYISDKQNSSVLDNGVAATLLALYNAAFAPNNCFALENFVLDVSVAANALTIAAKTQAGTTPSATDIAYCGFRSATLTSGIFNRRSITGALSITIPASTTIGTINGKSEWIYVYLLDNAGTPEFAVSLSNIFDQALVYTSTAVSGGTNRQVLYSTTARTSVPIRLVGKINITEATAGTWASAPTSVSGLPITDALQFSSQVLCDTGNGYGSTNTLIRRYTNGTTTGSDITYADSATLGALFTINTYGRYVVYRGDQSGAGSYFFGLSRNANVATAIDSLNPFTTRLAMVGMSGTIYTSVTWEGYLNPGDLIRPQDGASQKPNAADNTAYMSIIRVA